MPILNPQCPIEVAPPLPPGGAYVRPTEPLPLYATLVIIEPVSLSTAELVEDIELKIMELRRGCSLPVLMGLHLTYWPLGLAYGEEWGLDFLILHEEFFYDLHSYLPEGPWLDKVGDWIPPTPWRLLAPSYHPSLAQIEKFNHYLSRLQSLRKKIGHIPSQSTIFRTVTTKGETYIHFSQKALESY